MQAQFKPEKIPCGLLTKDGNPRHNEIKKDAMMTRLAERQPSSIWRNMNTLAIMSTLVLAIAFSCSPLATLT